MSVYRPKRKGEGSKFYVCDFTYQGKRIQESTGCTSKTAARVWEQVRKRELERAHAGIPSERSGKRILTVAEIIKPYLAGYKLSHRPTSITFATIKLARVERVIGSVLLSDLTEDRIRDYVRLRLFEKASGRTINMELGELSRAIGRPWALLWPKVRKLEERKDVGRALANEEQERILDASASLRSPVVRTMIPLLLLTGMRIGEAMSLRWGQIDLFEKTVRVGRAKTANGTGRVIPLNDELAGILAAHRVWFVKTFGEPTSAQCVFPFGSPQPTDPNRPVTTINTGWDLIRESSKVKCRLHDLRHTFCTHLAESGASESTMLALMGHMSRSMLERYSHIRMAAKREAVACVTLRQKPTISEALPVKVPVVSQTGRIQ